MTMPYPVPPACVTAPLAMALWQMRLHPWHGMQASMCPTPLVALVLQLPPLPTPTTGALTSPYIANPWCT